MKAVLLAAGYATRLHPLTRDRAKPLLEVGGRPILSHILERVLELPGLSEVVVVGNAKFSGQLRAWAEGAACPVPLRILDDGSRDDAGKLGASGDLAFALREVPLAGEDLVVAAGDNLLGGDLRPLQAAFLATRRPTLVVREEEPRRGPSPYNEVTLQGDRVVGFVEKPARQTRPLSAIALYFYPPEIEGFLRRYLAEGGNPDAPGYFVEWLVGRTDVRAVRYAGDWFDIGSLETLEAARARFG